MLNNVSKIVHFNSTFNQFETANIQSIESTQLEEENNQQVKSLTAVKITIINNIPDHKKFKSLHKDPCTLTKNLLNSKFHSLAFDGKAERRNQRKE